jgi:hypothetical protein
MEAFNERVRERELGGHALPLAVLFLKFAQLC